MKMALHSLTRVLVLIGWLLSPLSLWAAEVKGLYQVSVPVADRSDSERQRAMADGFQQVLVRVSGDSGVSGGDVLASASSTADRYVLQYGYETRSAGDSDQAGIYLNLQYDPNGIHNLLQRSGLPLWSSNRPRILLWMAWEQGLDRELVSASSMPGPFRMLQAEAKRRGVAFRFPEFDADDQSQVSLGDIWGMFPEPVLAASERYQTPVVVMAKVRESTSAIQINAMLQLDGQPYWFELARSDTGVALRHLVDQVTDKIASKYAVVSSADTSQQVVLQVDGVNELDGYAKLTRYLDRVVAISQYQLQVVQGSQVAFLVNLATDLGALEQTFRLDGKMSVSDQPVLQVPAGPVGEAVVAEPAQAEGEAEPAEGEPAAAGPSPVTVPSATATQPAVAPGPPVIRYRWQG